MVKTLAGRLLEETAKTVGDRLGHLQTEALLNYLLPGKQKCRPRQLAADCPILRPRH